VAYVGAGTATSGGGSSAITATPALPNTSLLQDGDFLVAVVWWAHRNGTSGNIAVDASGNWSLLTSNTLDLSGTSNDGLLCTYKAVYATGMPAPEFLCFGGAGAASVFVARVLAIRDVDTGSPLLSHTAVSLSGADGAGAAFTSQVPAVGSVQLGIAVKWKTSTGYSVSGTWQPVGITSTDAGDDATLVLVQRALSTTTATGEQAVNLGAPQGYTAAKAIMLRPTAAGLTVVPDFIVSAEAFYAPVVSKADDKILAPGFISSAEAFYTPVVSLSGITPTFIGSAEEFYIAAVTVIAAGGGIEEPIRLQQFGADVFPSGTVVTIHEAHKGWPDRAPVGAALSMATVDELGSFQASGLMDGNWYVAYAFVAGKHRYLRFRFEASPS
jgi:hypothetical protein